MQYGVATVRLDVVELEYLLDLVERDQMLDGALIGIDVQALLADALDMARKNEVDW